jgi:periplasmic protein TonB
MNAPIESGLKLTAVGGLHLLLLGGLTTAGLQPQVKAAISRMDIRLIEYQTPRQARPPLPQPLAATQENRVPPAPVRPPRDTRPQRQAAVPAKRAPASPPIPKAPEPPAPALLSTAVSPSTLASPQPSAPPEAAPGPAAHDQVSAPAQTSAAPAAARVPPRFDAGYLHNPAPAYPRASRLAGQQGQVVVKVLVSAEGSAVSVSLQRSSGFARLDEAALAAVRQWRFVPATRGADAFEEWVLVPIAFRLDTQGG